MATELVNLVNKPCFNLGALEMQVAAKRQSMTNADEQI
jgi:hypothetical protein